jgi:hypothetical protein
VLVSTKATLTAGAISTSYSVTGPDQPAGTAQIYGIAYVRDKSGAVVASKPSAAVTATFNANPVTGVQVTSN